MKKMLDAIRKLTYGRELSTKSWISAVGFASSQVALFGRFLKTIEDLEKDILTVQYSNRLTESRGNFKIIVIDDKEFTPANNLRRYHFHISHFEDIPTIDSVAQYPIVLCDLLGVGLGFAPNLQGAEIIKEIKRSYPEKCVIAYTGGGSSEVTEVARIFADKYLKKDAGPDEWCETLDEAIREVSNPGIVWKKTRIGLLKAGATPIQVTLLEDAFVRNFHSNRDQCREILINKIDDFRLSASVKSVAESLIASAIFHFSLV